jgi:hypothetical protein
MTALRFLMVVPMLVSCAVHNGIDYGRPPPADWPELKVVVFDMSRAEVEKRCPPKRPGWYTNGCAKVVWCAKTCEIYMSSMMTTGRNYFDVLEHERAHCRGYNHPGETSTSDRWERAKATLRCLR